MYAYRIAYDGHDYHGFQRQPDVVTVEDAILDALVALNVLDRSSDVPPSYAAAGRTDAGVSALAQTVAFDAPDWLDPAALNAHLPDDVQAWARADVHDEFHATHDATAREYEYRLYVGSADERRESERGGTIADRAGMAAERLSGEHDFHNLTPDERGTERELSVEVDVDGGWLTLTFHADGYSRQLVRRATSLVREVAIGTAGMGRIDRTLGDEPLSGPEGIAPASPYPLVLVAVEYPGVRFSVDKTAAADARELFERRRVELAARLRVAGRIAAGIPDRPDRTDDHALHDRSGARTSRDTDDQA